MQDFCSMNCMWRTQMYVMMATTMPTLRIMRLLRLSGDPPVPPLTSVNHPWRPLTLLLCPQLQTQILTLLAARLALLFCSQFQQQSCWWVCGSILQRATAHNAYFWQLSLQNSSVSTTHGHIEAFSTQLTKAQYMKRCKILKTYRVWDSPKSNVLYFPLGYLHLEKAMFYHIYL